MTENGLYLIYALALQGKPGSHPLHPPLPPPLPGHIGAAAPRVIAYNLGNLLRRLVLPVAIQSWSLTHPATRRKLLDREPLSADCPAHRAVRVAPDVIKNPTG